MVVAADDTALAYDKVSETIAVVERPSYQKATVYSELLYTDNRRHKEQVDFRPVLHPVKYSDTAYLWLNNTRRRFVSRTYYEPRVRPRNYSETTFARPKIAEQRFVSFLDVRDNEKRKWYKTAVEIQPRKFTSAKTIRSANNNYINSDAATAMNGPKFGDSNDTNNNDNSGFEDNTNRNNGLLSSHFARHRLTNGEEGEKDLGAGFAERVDPGASQVYIPRRLRRPLDQDCLANGDLLIDFNGGRVPMSNGVPSSRYPDVL